MPVNLESTTDSKEQVQAAVGKAVAPKVDVEEPKQSATSEKPSTEKVEAKEDESAEESETLEAQTDEDDGDEDTEGDKNTKKPFKNVQKRIDKLTKRNSDYKRETEYWKAEALKNQTQQQKPEEQKPVVQAKADDGPQPEGFENHSDYVKAVAKWEIRQELSAEKAKSREDSLRQEMHQKRVTFAEEAKKVAESETDYDDVMDGIEGLMIPPSVQAVLLESESGARLAYELAKKPEEFQRICNLSPLAAAREIGKIEARLVKEEPKEIKVTKTTTTPKPLTPVGSKSIGATVKAVEEMSFNEYKKHRLKEMS